MSEPSEQRAPYMSTWPVVLASSNDKIWKGFKFLDLRVSAEGFVDSYRPSFNIEHILGPMKFRPVGQRNFSDVPTYPRLHRPREEVHGYWRGAQRGLQLIMESETFERLMHQPFRIEEFKNIKENDLVVEHLLNSLSIDARRHHIDGPLLGEAILTATIHYLLRDSNLFSQNRSDSNISSYQLKQIKDWIDENLGRPISLTDLSRESDLSARHLSRVFRAETGFSPYNYILHRRVERAKQLVQAGRLNFSEIALVVGFANQGHMADVFRKLLGASPSHFCNKAPMFSARRHNLGQIEESGVNQEDES